MTGAEAAARRDPPAPQEGRAGELAELARALSSASLHEWTELRRRCSSPAVFVAAVGQVLAGWGALEQVTWVRTAVVDTAADLVLAVPTWAGADPVDPERVRRAREQLEAIELLALLAAAQQVA